MTKWQLDAVQKRFAELADIGDRRASARVSEPPR
jgi:hypothetical protein